MISHYRRRWTAVWLPAAILVFAPYGAFAQDAGDALAVLDVTVIPMSSETLLQHRTVLVEGGRIISVEAADSAEVPDGYRRIDGAGLYLLPGLTDLHVHIRNREELFHYLAWGVTTVMHLGGSGESGATIRDYREQVKAGRLAGPNIYTTDRVLDGDPALPASAHSLTDPGEASKVVEALAEDGFDFVKIYNNVSQPVFDAIVEEADRRSVPVIGHIPRGFDPRLSLGGGQDAIAHTEELFFTWFEGPRSTEDMPRDYAPDLGSLDELIDLLLDNRVATMPDLSFTFTNLLMWDDLELVRNDPEFDYLHPATATGWMHGNLNRRDNLHNFILREQWKYDLMRRLTVEFQRAGVLQVVGTDSSLPGLFPGKAVHRELTELVKAGLSNYEALAVATRNAGEFFSRYFDGNVRSGRVEPGYQADLVLLRENPLEDVRHARSISGVMVNGRYTGREELDARRDALRRRYAELGRLGSAVEDALQGDDARTALDELLGTHRNDPEALGVIEHGINAAGYGAGFDGDLDRAERLLELNTELFPGSANAWDSLAEVVLYRGDRERALALYRKALDIDPAFANAARQIEAIRSQ